MIDAELIFDGVYTSGNTPPWAGVAITATRVSSNVLDLLAARDIGIGNDIEMHVDITTTFTTTNSATLQIDFETCATVGGSYTPLIDSPVYPVAQLVAGAPIFRYILPVNQELNSTAGVLNTPGRYIRLNYNVGTGVFSAGAVLAFLTGMKDRFAFQPPPNNYALSVPVGEI